MRTLRLEGRGGHDEDAAADLGHNYFPTPLQAAYVAVAQSGVDREQDHAR